MDSKYCVLDVETTVNNTHQDKKKCGLANPFCEDNRIVAFGLKTIDIIAPILFYEKEKPFEYIRLRRSKNFIKGMEEPKGYQDVKNDEWVDKFLKSVTNCPILVGHNIAFDICHIIKNNADNKHVDTLRSNIMDNKIVVWDTMLVEYILSGQSWRYPSLDDVCVKYGLTIKNDELKALWDSGTKTEEIPKDVLLPYLEHDVEVTEQVFKKQLREVHEKELKSIVFDELRARMTTIIAEYNGMAFDETHAFRLHKMLDGDIVEIESNLLEFLLDYNNITEYSRHFIDNINFGSHDQVSAMLFGGTLKWKEERAEEDEHGDLVVYKSGKKKGNIKYRKVEFTQELLPMYVPNKKWESKKAGVFFTSDEVLQELLDSFGTARKTSNFVSNIQEHRQLKKERDTYLTGLTKVCWNDGLLHPTFNHVETPTGRLSCRNPNLQNITAK
tara:strand:+ start:1956 stop:3281 length:1326 start_codon:yes stop_codon:yes gene_type:complete